MEIGSLAFVALVVFLVIWYGKAVNKLFAPVGQILDASAMHATVYSAEIKNNAINRGADLQVDKAKVTKAKANLKAINDFSIMDDDDATAKA